MQQTTFKDEERNMIMFTCRRCGHTTDRKHSLLLHLQRKKTCFATDEDVPVDELIEELTSKEVWDKSYDCENCGRVFKTRQGKCKHKKNCFVDKKNDEIQELKRQIEELKSAVASKPVVANNTTNNNNGTINNTVNNNIHIHAFKKEDVQHILDHLKFHDAMLQAVQKRKDGVMYLIGKKHFDPNHPENHTIKKMKKKDPFIEIYDGKQWVLRDQEDVLEEVFIGVHNLFSHFVDQYTGDWKKMKCVLDEFMRTVGQPLNWDLNSDEYEYNREMDDKQKDECRKRLFRLAYEYIYRRSSELFA